jgi:hypothetical protein
MSASGSGEIQPRKIRPVVVAHTTNPEDRQALVGPDLGVVLSHAGLAFTDDSWHPVRDFSWDRILRAVPHPLSDPDPIDWEAPQIPRCRSCNTYYPRGEHCEKCVLLLVTDPLTVYEAFHYGLRFSDPYYREAFLKWLGEHH